MCSRYAHSSYSLLCDVHPRTKYVDHLHEHFRWPCTINENGRYNVPDAPEEGYRHDYSSCSPVFILILTAISSIEMKPESIAEFEFPIGAYWQSRLQEGKK